MGVNFDLNTMLSMHLDLQRKGAIRAEVGTNHVKAHAWTTASTILVDLQPCLLKTVFDRQRDIASCKFVATITDTAGDQETAFAYDMSRTIYTTTDWSSYSTKTLTDVAENFRLGPATVQHMHAETK